MAVTKAFFGETKDGKAVDCYTITNKNGMSAEIITFGAILKNLYVPDKKGKAEDIVLGYDELWKYFKNGSFFGATVGPIANRIKDGAYKVDGKKVQLPVNDNANNLHSDFYIGFHKRVWTAEAGKNSVTFSLVKKDKEMGHPGNMKVSVTYTLTDKNELKIDYHATTDKKTVINMTNHTYFNLGGISRPDVEDIVLTINASKVTAVDKELIPTGEFMDVKGTPLDFTKPKKIGKDLHKKEFKPIKIAKGFDHNFVVDGYNGKKKLIAEASDAKSGRKMQVYSDLPGVQFYSGNCIGKNIGKGGFENHPFKGFCLETQYFPDAINHENFKQPVFGPEEEYKTTTVYQFSW